MMDVTSVKRIHQSDWTNSGIRFLRARDIVSAAKMRNHPIIFTFQKKNIMNIRKIQVKFLKETCL